MDPLLLLAFTPLNSQKRIVDKKQYTPSFQEENTYKIMYISLIPYRGYWLLGMNLGWKDFLPLSSPTYTNLLCHPLEGEG